MQGAEEFVDRRVVEDHGIGQQVLHLDELAHHSVEEPDRAEHEAIVMLTAERGDPDDWIGKAFFVGKNDDLSERCLSSAELERVLARPDEHTLFLKRSLIESLAPETTAFFLKSGTAPTSHYSNTSCATVAPSLNYGRRSIAENLT